jgi:hypothetical protein
MSINQQTILRNEGALTPLPDKKGVVVLLCDPGWFDVRKKYKISNAPERTSSLEFDGGDLNFLARVLYAEASGTAALPDKAERDKEKEAIMNVNHFRLNRPYYPRRDYVATTFSLVCKAPGQFESVFANKPKFLNSIDPAYNHLIKTECADLSESIEAIKNFLIKGPNADYLYDGFLGYSANGRGTHIGRSRFFLSERGKEFIAKDLAKK